MKPVCGPAASISGEHGVGLDKRELAVDFSPTMIWTRCCGCVPLHPLGNYDPGKIIPVLRGCGEGPPSPASQTMATVKKVDYSPGPQVFRPQERAVASMSSLAAQTHNQPFVNLNLQQRTPFDWSRRLQPKKFAKLCGMLPPRNSPVLAAGA